MTSTLIFCGIAIFIGAFSLGVILTDAKWRANADKPMRIYSRNKLYKVLYDEDYEVLEDNYP